MSTTLIWGIILIAAIIYVGIDYGRLIIVNRRLQQENESGFTFIPYVPTMHIMIDVKDGKYITNLSAMDLKAHMDAGIDIKTTIEKEGYSKTIFDNGDQLIIYCYDKTKIEKLSKSEIENYEQKLFFDYNLPQGAERAIVEQLGLLGYMVNIGFCSNDKGVK